MLLLEKHGTRHHEAPWLINGKLYLVILHAHHSLDPRKRGQEQREMCSIQAKEWEYLNRSRTWGEKRPEKDTGHTSMRTMDVARQDGDVESMMISGSPELRRYKE